MNGGHGEGRRPGRRPLLSAEVLWCAAVGVVAVLVELLVAWFMKSKGAGLTGDEPSYIIQAQAFAHLSPHILATIKADLAAHALSAYPVGAPVSAVAYFPGPHGIISAFEPGLGILLIPFVATGHLFLGAVVGMLVLNTAGLILIHRRATRLCDLGGRGQVLFAMLLAAPALVMAMNQIYPDLVSGVLVACPLIEIALLERTRSATRTGTAIVAVSVFLLPWLQVKNIVPAVVLVAAFAVAARRADAAWRPVVAVAVSGVVGWVLLFGYNHVFYGLLGGLPEPFPRPSVNGVEYTLGLLFDRHQGLFVQAPFAVLGAIGLWVARRRLPVAVIATVVGAGSILLLNGTYTSNPYGGLSLAGRFMWTLLPVALTWAAVVIARWEDAGRLLWTPILLVTAVGLYQVVPVLRGDHVYYNAFSVTAPWDPSTWPGWWPGINRALPQFDLPGHPLGAPSYALLVELALLAVLAIASIEYMRPGPFPRWSLAAMGGLGVLVVVALVAAEPLHPTTALTYDAAQLGAPVVGGAQGATSPDVTLQGVLPSTYRFTLTYDLRTTTGGSAQGGLLSVFCNTTSGAPPLQANRPLPPDRTSAVVTIHCDVPGTVSSVLAAGPGAVLGVHTLRLERAGP